MLQIVESLTADSGAIIYNCSVFLVQANGLIISLPLSWNLICLVLQNVKLTE